jgi:hypothetical protein
MRKYSKGLLTAVAALATLAACGTPAASTDSPSPGGAGNAQTEVAAPKPALPTNGKCVLITADKAASLVGSTVTSSSSNATGSAGIARVDGCTFVGTASNLGYDINNFSGGAATASAFVAQAKTAMAGRPGITPFDVTGGDASVGFTSPVAAKVMARIQVAKGPYTIDVNATAADAETAKKISTSALAVLLDAVG